MGVGQHLIEDIGGGGGWKGGHCIYDLRLMADDEES
jgi:hypothetical protein